MGSVLKGNRYRLVDNRSFDLPLPLKYELLKEDTPVAVYEVSEDEKVTYQIVTKYKENMITPIYRPLDISDVYYFFSCRVFQDKTPFTMTELSLLGLEKYNVYDIIRKTRGVTPYDTYWLRFDGDTCDYETARNAWACLMQQAGASGAQKAQEKSEPSKPKSDANVNEILNQHKVDIAAKFAAKEEISKEELGEPEPVTNNTMSADEIEALLLKSGLTNLSQSDEAPEKPEPAPEEKSSGGMMSEDEIAAMLAAASAPETEEAPAEDSAPDVSADIDAILEATEAELVSEPEPEATAEPEPAPEPAPVEEKPAGGKMSQADIEAMLAAASAPETEEVPAEDSAPDVSADIDAILEAAEAELVSEPEPEATAEPEPAPVEEKPAGGKMSQADIEAMLAAASALETEETTAEDSAPDVSADIDAILEAAEAELVSEPEPEATTELEPAPEPAPVEEKPAGGKMSQADIEAMLAAAAETVEPAVEEAAEAVQETLEEAAPEAAPDAEETPAEPAASSGGKMSEADIEALLSGMKEDAAT